MDLSKVLMRRQVRCSSLEVYVVSVPYNYNKLMQVIVDNLAVNYELTGSGKTIVLLHGWGDNHATFNRLIERLQARFRLLSLDLPGFGGSQPPLEPWNLDNYAHFVASLLKKLNITPYAFIGHSNGGALAIRGLSQGVLDADKLVLLASAGVRNSQPLKRLTTKTVAKAGKATTFWLPRDTRQALRRKLYGTIGSDLLVAPMLEQTFKLTVRQDVQADAEKLTLPTLIINADHDPAIPLSDGKRFHELIPGSKLEVLSSTTHFIHQEETPKVATLILGFL